MPVLPQRNCLAISIRLSMICRSLECFGLGSVRLRRIGNTCVLRAEWGEDGGTLR
jgi:hypothetical protein